jgi:hypothetical protein
MGEWISQGLNTSVPENKKELKMFDNGVKDETTKGLDVLVYGDSNTGKTYFAATFPEPVFFIDTEGRANKTRQFHFANKVIKIASPMEIRGDYKTEKEIENAVDMEKSVDNLINALVDVANHIKENNIKQGTVVVDSLTDVWTWTQEEGKIRLAKAGKVDMAQFRLKSQFDWGGITNKYLSFLLSVKKLAEYGINVVLTSREKKTPDYVAGAPTGIESFEDKIKTQKDTPYHISTIINLDVKNIKTSDGVKQKRVAKIEKLESISGDSIEIENITYEKLKAIVDEKRSKLIGGVKQ